MAVRVIDSIMGSGKSTAAINFINQHYHEKKFIYVTEYLPEAKRIAQDCPSANMQEPDNTDERWNNSKTNHLKHLVAEGHNIACSHVLFKWCPQDILDDIKAKGYTIIIDEVIDIFENADISFGDIDFLLENGVITATQLDDAGDIVMYELKADHNYHGTAMQRLFKKISRQPILLIKDREEGSNGKLKTFSRQWLLPKELFEASDEIYILTYMFDGTPLNAFLEMNNFPVEYWCITTGENGLTFGNSDPHIPDYAYTIKDMIHVCRDEKRNSIGDPKFALSVNWYKRNRRDLKSKKLENLHANLRWFMRDNEDVPKHHYKERMWTSFKEGQEFLVDGGYTHAEVTFNKRAVNEYRDRKVLAYCANIFAKPGLVKYCQLFGIEYNEDQFALSTLVQWIWRSAIRDGQEIWLYLPSQRMRDLLDKWLEETSTGIVTGYQRHHS